MTPQTIVQYFKTVLLIFLIFILQNLDLTKKTMVHEGPLLWKVNKDKTIGWFRFNSICLLTVLIFEILLTFVLV